MSLLFSDDSEFEADALKRAVDADRDAQPVDGAPPRLAVRIVLVIAATALLCALSVLAMWGAWR